MNEQRFPKGWDEQRVKRCWPNWTRGRTRSGSQRMRRRPPARAIERSLPYRRPFCLRFDDCSHRTRLEAHS
jgi:hypothetical protein